MGKKEREQCGFCPTDEQHPELIEPRKIKKSNQLNRHAEYDTKMFYMYETASSVLSERVYHQPHSIEPDLSSAAKQLKR